MEATLDVLTEQGLAGLTVNEVAERAGVNQVSIYRNWGTREKLMLDALLSRSREQLPIPDTGTLRGDLTEFGTRVLEYLHTPFGQATARAVLAAGDDPGVRAAQDEFWAARSEVAGTMFARAVERGEISAGVDTRLVLEMLVAPLHFRVLQSREPIDHELPGRLAALITDGLR